MDRSITVLHKAGADLVMSYSTIAANTVINLLSAVILFGLLAMGILWIIKTAGQAGQQYSDAMIQTSHQASAIKCQSNLRTIYQSIQMYAVSNEELPSSQESLKEYCGYGSRLFHCDEPNAPEYVYIAGQNMNMPPAEGKAEASKLAG